MENGKAKSKKETKSEKIERSVSIVDGYDVISSKAELKNFLQVLRDRMAERAAAPIYAVSAMNHVLTLPKVYDLLDNENKEIARDIWLRIKQSGMQVKNPPMLFGDEANGVVGK